jgi:hypothetical protein
MTERRSPGTYRLLSTGEAFADHVAQPDDFADHDRSWTRRIQRAVSTLY